MPDLTERLAPKPKFYRRYGEHHLWGKQVDTYLWRVVISSKEILLPLPITDPDTGDVVRTEVCPYRSWDAFTCRTEDCAKRCALAVIDNRLGGPPLDDQGFWSDDSIWPDEELKAHLESLGFTGPFET